MDVNNFRLLRHAASTKLPIILSTGMASVAEIDEALNVIANENNDQVILLHCISIYPPRDEDIHLNNLAMLRQCFGLPCWAFRPLNRCIYSIGVCGPRRVPD